MDQHSSCDARGCWQQVAKLHASSWARTVTEGRHRTHNQTFYEACTGKPILTCKPTVLSPVCHHAALPMTPTDDDDDGGEIAKKETEAVGVAAGQPKGKRGSER